MWEARRKASSLLLQNHRIGELKEMCRRTALVAMLISVLSIMPRRAMAGDETGVRDFVTRWNAAYTGLNAKALASPETPNFELIDPSVFGLSPRTGVQ
jgi:hypothetical protein